MNHKIITLENLKEFKKRIGTNKAIENVVVPGYTKHGGYFLQDTITPNKTYYNAVSTIEEVTLTVTYSDETSEDIKITARTLAKEELETISDSNKRIGYLSSGSTGWYWTSTPNGSRGAWNVSSSGGFDDDGFDISGVSGGARLGFKDPFEGYLLLDNNYELYGNYFLQKTITANKNYYEACEMVEPVDFVYWNYKGTFTYRCMARTLAKAELETISDSNERIGHLSNGSTGWYWTSTPNDSKYAWSVNNGGGFYSIDFDGSGDSGGARLGFKNPFI